MDTYQKFLKQFRIKRFKKGELILVQGEVPTCAHIVKSGVVKAYNLTQAGEEKPIGFDTEGDLFPIAWVFSKIRSTMYYYEAFTDCEIYCVPLQDYQEFIHEDVERMTDVYDDFIRKVIGFQMRINALEQSKAHTKIINILHCLCVNYGVPQRGDVVKIKLPLTQQDMANFIGLTRETTGIELKKLQKKGVLTSKKQHYYVHKDKLNGFLDEDYALVSLTERM
ncbi:MAG: Crp/Fnr family transcriptional regulator [Acidobacteriota bacterium]